MKIFYSPSRFKSLGLGRVRSTTGESLEVHGVLFFFLSIDLSRFFFFFLNDFLLKQSHFDLSIYAYISFLPFFLNLTSIPV